MNREGLGLGHGRGYGHEEDEDEPQRGDPVQEIPLVLCPPALRSLGYSIGEELGTGSFSTVYQAKLTTGKPGKVREKQLAVKVIKLDQASREWRVNSMKTVLKIMKKINHPNIVKIWHLVKTFRRIFIFMDKTNSSLAHYLYREQNNPLSEDTARIWFLELMSALSFLHSKGVAHRNVKTSSILLDQHFTLKLTGSTVGCFTFERTYPFHPLLSFETVGDAAYMAPEVNSPPYHAAVADIYSAGVVLYEMLTCKKPFNETYSRRTRPTTFDWQSHPSIAFGLSDQVKKLLVFLLDTNPGTRPHAAQVIGHSWLGIYQAHE